MIDKLRGIRRTGAALVAILAVACGSQQAANAPTATDVGITKDSIALGGTFPLSGTASAYAAVAKGMQAYFAYVNDQGGVNGRKINFTVVDDVYNPANTPGKARELVEQDKVFATVGDLGTAANLSVRDYYNQQQVPQLYVFTGSDHWGNDYGQYPWTLGWQPDYQAEGKIYAKDILANHPNAKVGIIYQNDDYGKDYVAGMNAGLGAKASTMIVKTATYNAGDPVDLKSQVTTLKDSGADTFFVVTTPSYSASALINAYTSGWKPKTIYLNNVGASSTILLAVKKALGTDAGTDGIYSTTYLKDPNDPAQQSDPGIVKYTSILTKYQPDCKVIDAFCVAGMACAYSVVDLLKKLGQNLSRKNFMDTAAKNFKESDNFLLLPGITVQTTASDHFPIRQEKLEIWKTDRYMAIGDLLSAR